MRVQPRLQLDERRPIAVQARARMERRHALESAVEQRAAAATAAARIACVARSTSPSMRSRASATTRVPARIRRACRSR